MANLQKIGAGSRPDGVVRYRTDRDGTRVGVLPARCKRQLHSLHEAGYKAVAEGGELRVTCTACWDEPNPDHSWHLTLTKPTPARAELDDAPYAGITPHFQQTPVPARTEPPQVSHRHHQQPAPG
ncbi:hypothetical protein ACIA8G_35115 [Lentzea sp. NPDC051213]|uniref:hypothetical protein n=1 Tax=Lentzea sp. NPDC051213 TaxID=3364126 RepID=UPI0037ACD2ED